MGIRAFAIEYRASAGEVLPNTVQGLSLAGGRQLRIPSAGREGGVKRALDALRRARGQSSIEQISKISRCAKTAQGWTLEPAGSATPAEVDLPGLLIL